MPTPSSIASSTSRQFRVRVDVTYVNSAATPLTGTPAAASLAFHSATTYLSQAPGPLVVRLTTPGTLNAVGGAAGFTLQPGTCQHDVL